MSVDTYTIKYGMSDEYFIDTSYLFISPYDLAITVNKCMTYNITMYSEIG